MLLNYLKTTIRAIRKSPIYGLLNIAGLALGIACAALIFLWVEYELGFDHKVAKRNVLYSIRMNIDYTSRIESFTTAPGPMSKVLHGTIPGIVNTSGLGFGRELFTLKDKSLYEFGFYIDTGYFSMVQPVFVRGSIFSCRDLICSLKDSCDLTSLSLPIFMVCWRWASFVV